MIFHEVYSAYYQTVAAILTAILEGEHSEKALRLIVTEQAFGESVLTVLPSLKSGKWQLVRSDLTTRLAHRPTLPLTLLEKRWLKAISLDPRIALFDAPFPDLDGIEPLFTAEDYRVYDRYGDGDPFSDADYIRRFRVIREAIREGTPLRISMRSRNRRTVSLRCQPIRLEYSEKDDKFRMIAIGLRRDLTVNLAKLLACTPDPNGAPLAAEMRETEYDTVTVSLFDERNALERFMLHFAHFEKRAEQQDERHYTVTLRFPRADEAELVIRILSFGPMVEVTAPERFRSLIIEKLKKQLNCGLF